jgi:ketosteroid isomerase-like protein
MRADQQLVLEAAYASWEAQDLSLLAYCMHENAVSFIRLPPGAWPMTGVLRGKATVLAALGKVSRDFDVLEYRPTRMHCPDGNGIWKCHARIHYRHRATGLSYEASVRNVWTIVGDKIASYEVFHDAGRLRAFFELVKRADADA